MNKKLLAVAVAGVLAAPAAAVAQSSVTISGVFKVSWASIHASNRGAAVGRSGEDRVEDESSAIRFNVVEDLGGGLQAIGQVDWRMQIDNGGDGAVGNNHVGLRSKNWGRLILGRQDIHYFNRESLLTVTGSLKADSISLLAFAGGGGVAIANATRTPNIIHYTTPNWGGFTLIAAYSTNPLAAAEADSGSTIRKGRGWHLNPNFAGRNFQVGYSYVSAKGDAAGAGLATADQRGDRLYGSMTFGGFKVGLAWDKSKLKTASGATAGTTVSNRTAWSLPVQYTWGSHGIYAHYTVARDDKATPGVADGAKMFALSYGYYLSKRTSLGLTYAKISNDAGAAYNLFTTGGALGNPAGAIGGANAAINPAGSDPRIISATVRHTF